MARQFGQGLEHRPARGKEFVALEVVVKHLSARRDAGLRGQAGQAQRVGTRVEPFPLHPRRADVGAIQGGIKVGRGQRRRGQVRHVEDLPRDLIHVKAPWPALLHQLEPGLVVAVDQLVGHLAGGRLVGQFERLGTEPLHADDGHHRVGDDPTDSGAWLKLFELDHAARSARATAAPRA